MLFLRPKLNTKIFMKITGAKARMALSVVVEIELRKVISFVPADSKIVR